MKFNCNIFFAISLTFICCGQANTNSIEVIQSAKAADTKRMLNDKGTTLETRFNSPAGYERKPVDANSFAFYLRNLPLKPAGSKVKYYDGTTKEDPVYDAVVDMEISNKDLQQCAVIRV